MLVSCRNVERRTAAETREDITALDLLALLSRFDNLSDRETDHAYFRTLVPSVAKYGYLSVVFKPQAPDIVAAVSTELNLPPALCEFYTSWNGARLFFGALSIRGCLPAGQLLNRSDPFALLPFDLRESGRGLASRLERKGLLRIGTYNADGSIVCISRDSGRVECYVEEDLGRVRQAWGSVNEWLVSEIARISLLFDSKGNRLVTNGRFLLPGTEARPN
jgi:hypothetical protein